MVKNFLFTSLLKLVINNFIKQNGCNIVYDPFAGGGNMLDAVAHIETIDEFIGLDINPDCK